MLAKLQKHKVFSGLLFFLWSSPGQCAYPNYAFTGRLVYFKKAKSGATNEIKEYLSGMHKR